MTDKKTEETKAYRDMLDETEKIMNEPGAIKFSELREGGPLFESYPDPNEPEEITRNRQKQMDDGTYTDDGGIPRACKHCGKERPILSVADCCEKAKKKQNDRMDKTFRAVAGVFRKFEREDEQRLSDHSTK